MKVFISSHYVMSGARLYRVGMVAACYQYNPGPFCASIQLSLADLCCLLSPGSLYHFWYHIYSLRRKEEE